MKPTFEARVFAAELLDLIDHTFFQAYFSHTNGMSEDEMLITYDIEAAAFDVDEAVRITCRTTIKSAVKAVDSSLPFVEARTSLQTLLQQRLAEIFGNKPATKRKLNRQFVCNSISHALD